MDSTRLIQAVFYNDPDGYPPIINSTRILSEAGFQVDILCRRQGQGSGIIYPQTSVVQPIAAKVEASWRAYFQFVVAALRKARPNAQLFVGHDMHGLLPAYLLAKRHRRPLIYHCHDFAESKRDLSMGSYIVRWFERRIAHYADLVIIPDAERVALIKNELHLKRAPLVVANAPIKCPSSGRNRLCEELKKRGIKFSQVVFRQGSLGPFHAIETTLESIPLWNDELSIFVVMGHGESEYINSLVRLAQHLKVSDRFVVLPAISYDEVADFTVGAQIGHGLYLPVNINHIAATTASNKIMEYLAAGLPIIVSERPGLQALIQKYGCGFTANENSPPSIALAVNKLLGNRELAAQMGIAARQAFMQEFNYTRQFAPALAAIERLTQVH